MDTLSPEERSRRMAKIRSKDTKPELKVRRILFSLGYRYRLHDRRLPGTPDIVLNKYKTVVFVNGCFWHGHKNCRHARLPKSNRAYWLPKIMKNIKRDRKHERALKKAGWRVMRIWECQTRSRTEIVAIIRRHFRK